MVTMKRILKGLHCYERSQEIVKNGGSITKYRCVGECLTIESARRWAEHRQVSPDLREFGDEFALSSMSN